MANLRQVRGIQDLYCLVLILKSILKKIGTLPDSAIQTCRKNLNIMLDLDE